MRMVAALAGAGALLAAAGALRAVLIVVAFFVRPVAPALLADGALRAIPVVAALGADRTLGVPVLAADQPVAAVELDSIGGFEQTAEVARALAAVAFGDAFIDAANLTDEAGDLQASAFEAEIAVRAVGIIFAIWLARLRLTGPLAAIVPSVAILVGLALAGAARFGARLAVRATAGSEKAVLAGVILVTAPAPFCITNPVVLNEGAQVVVAHTSAAFIDGGTVGIAAAVPGHTAFPAVDFVWFAATAARDFDAGAKGAISGAGFARTRAGGVAAHVLRGKATAAVLGRTDDAVQETTPTLAIANAWRSTLVRSAKGLERTGAFRAGNIAGFAVVDTQIVTAIAIDTHTRPRRALSAQGARGAIGLSLSSRTTHPGDPGKAGHHAHEHGPSGPSFCQQPRHAIEVFWIHCYTLLPCLYPSLKAIVPVT